MLDCLGLTIYTDVPMPLPESFPTNVNELLHTKFEVLLTECDLVADQATYDKPSTIWTNFFSPKDENSSKKPSKQNSRNVEITPPPM